MNLLKFLTIATLSYNTQKLSILRLIKSNPGGLFTNFYNSKNHFRARKILNISPVSLISPLKINCLKILTLILHHSLNHATNLASKQIKPTKIPHPHYTSQVNIHHTSNINTTKQKKKSTWNSFSFFYAKSAHSLTILFTVLFYVSTHFFFVHYVYEEEKSRLCYSKRF